MHFMQGIWSNLKMQIHWICALNSWFLLHSAFVFFYVLSWNGSIKGSKNHSSGDSRNSYYPITGSNYFACNPRPWWRHRYLCSFKEEFVKPLKFTNQQFHNTPKSWKQVLKKLSVFKAAQKSCASIHFYSYCQLFQVCQVKSI